MMKNKKLISIVIPTHNEKENIKQLCERLTNTFKSIPYSFELIFVDDSTDSTPQAIQEQINLGNNIKLIKLTRSFGQTIAIVAGMEASKGDALVMMDADLQDPPEKIVNLIDKWERGYDIVMVKRPSEKKNLFYFLMSKIFYYLQKKIADVNIPEGVGEFRLLDRKVVDVMNSLSEKTRYLRGLTLWPGFKTSFIKINRDSRNSGITKYNLRKSFNVAVDGFVGFSTSPLRLSTYLGTFMFLLSCFGALYAIFLRIFTDQWISGWTLMYVSIILLIGIQFILFGIMSEYISRIYTQILNRPLYIVDYIYENKKNKVN